MMGPGLCSLLLSACLTLSTFRRAQTKPVALSRTSGEPSQLVTRFRRDILPYEGEMFAYPPGDSSLRLALYPPLQFSSVLAQLGLSPVELEQLERQALGLGLSSGPARGSPRSMVRALQRLLEAGDHREQGTAYTAGLPRAWGGLGQSAAYTSEGAGPRMREGYLDYDGPRLEEEEEEEEVEGAPQTEEQLLRALVGHILAELDAKRELPSQSGLGGVQGVYPAPRRLRRSLDGGGTEHPSLLRIKRVGAGGDEEEEDGEDGEEEGGAHYPGPNRRWAKGFGFRPRQARMPLPSGHLARRLARLLPD